METVSQNFIQKSSIRETGKKLISFTVHLLAKQESLTIN